MCNSTVLLKRASDLSPIKHGKVISQNSEESAPYHVGRTICRLACCLEVIRDLGVLDQPEAKTFVLPQTFFCGVCIQPVQVSRSLSHWNEAISICTIEARTGGIHLNKALAYCSSLSVTAGLLEANKIVPFGLDTGRASLALIHSIHSSEPHKFRCNHQCPFMVQRPHMVKYAILSKDFDQGIRLKN